ncbi:class I SAM-dependent methyltransferase [Streptomyces sp. NPDC049099]|uniref:class I SAM-dependent methyltransferase n=1 Tax=Streptomyces sp. NPDC049099 TaxID=3155768 RepID=UPI003434E625
MSHSGALNTGSAQERLLSQQRAYYSALAPDYLDQLLDLPGGGELAEALDAFRPAGSVLELACRPGTWTPQLLRHASDVTAVEASQEMLAIAANRVSDGAQVRFVETDLFAWEPDRRYGVVFMGCWLSHVPAGRFESFWSLVTTALAPQGRVFFVDDHYRTPEELVEGPASSTIQRRIPDGTAYRIVKVPYEPAELERRLRELGWDITVTPTAGPFFWSAGNRTAES